MTESNASSALQSRQSLSAQTAGNNTQVRARAVDIPPSLPARTEPVTVRGEVVETARDGRVRIETHQGEIRVRVQEGPRFQNGQQVSVEIPPRQNPRQVTIRVLPPESGQAAQKPPPETFSADTRIARKVNLDEQTLRNLSQGAASRTAGVLTGAQNRISEHVIRLTPLPRTIQAVTTASGAGASVVIPQIKTGQSFLLSLAGGEKSGQTGTNTVNTAGHLQVLQTASGTGVLSPSKIIQGSGDGQTVQKTNLTLFSFNFSAPGLSIKPASFQILSLSAAPGLQTGTPENMRNGFMLAPTSAEPSNFQNLITNSETGSGTGRIFSYLQKNSAFQATVTNLSAAAFRIIPAGTETAVKEIGSGAVSGAGILQSQVTLAQSGNIKASEMPALKAAVIGTAPGQIPVVQLLSAGGMQPLSAGSIFLMESSIPAVPTGTEITLATAGLVNTGDTEGMAGQPGQKFPPAFSPALSPGSSSLTSPVPQPVPHFMQPGVWGAMSDLFKTTQQNPADVQSSFAFGGGAQGGIATTASSPAVMGAAALVFIAAARNGELGSWFGERAMSVIRKEGRMDLFQTVSRDAGGISKPSREQAGAPEWRGHSFPLIHNGDVHKIAMWYRQEKNDNPQDDGAENDKKASTRFLFDLSLDRMGPVQLDGLIRGERMDMILRTAHPLSEEMRRHMRGLYVRAVEQADLYGELKFISGIESMISDAEDGTDWSDVL